MLRVESREKYTADGYLDTEEADGNVISGSWRADEIDFTISLQKIRVTELLYQQNVLVTC